MESAFRKKKKTLSNETVGSLQVSWQLHRAYKLVLSLGINSNGECVVSVISQV